MFKKITYFLLMLLVLLVGYTCFVLYKFDEMAIQTERDGGFLRGYCENVSKQNFNVGIEIVDGKVTLELERDTFEFRYVDSANRFTPKSYCVIHQSFDLETEQNIFCLEREVLNTLISNFPFPFQNKNLHQNIQPNNSNHKRTKEATIMGTFAVVRMNKATCCALFGYDKISPSHKKCWVNDDFTIIFPLRIEDSTTVYFDVPLKK
jgi:hypothetical protein